MKLHKFKMPNNKRKIIVITIIFSILVLSSIYLYNSFAVFTEEKYFNVINGTIGDPGDVYFAYYVNDNITREMPSYASGYTLDSEKSNCTNGVTVSWNDSNWQAILDYKNYNATDYTRTRCNLYFKEKECVVNFETGNLLPDYPSSGWSMIGNATTTNTAIVTTNQTYETSVIQFKALDVMYSNAFHIILNDEENTIYLNQLLYGQANSQNEVSFDIARDTGWYTLETRLNGSNGDFRYYAKYYFVKGDKYKLTADIITSFDSVYWLIKGLMLKKKIAPITLKCGGVISKPSTSIYKPGYTVGNKWYTDYERTKEFDFNTPITSDITLYAGMEAN